MASRCSSTFAKCGKSGSASERDLRRQMNRSSRDLPICIAGTVRKSGNMAERKKITKYHVEGCGGVAVQHYVCKMRKIWKFIPAAFETPVEQISSRSNDRWPRNTRPPGNFFISHQTGFWKSVSLVETRLSSRRPGVRFIIREPSPSVEGKRNTECPTRSPPSRDPSRAR